MLTIELVGYPDNWVDVATAIKAMAGWRCEHCHHPNDYESGTS